MILSSDVALDAINTMLSAIGEAPVNTFESSENVDVVTALRILNRVNRQVQSKGWAFNHIEETTLNPDYYTNKIKWQDDILYIVGTDGEKYVQKGDYLYDFDEQTDIFTSSIDVELIREVDFEYMPPVVRDYIVARAARIFQAEALGDGEIGEHLASLENEAWAALQEYEMELGDYTVYDWENVQELTTR